MNDKPDADVCGWRRVAILAASALIAFAFIAGVVSHAPT